MVLPFLSSHWNINCTGHGPSTVCPGVSVRRVFDEFVVNERMIDPVWFIIEMQGWANTSKYINIIKHNNKKRRKVLYSSKEVLKVYLMQFNIYL